MKPEQRACLFQTRGNLQDGLCYIIMDGDVETHCKEKDFMDDLVHPTMKHPNPYTLNCLDNNNKITV